MWYEKKLKPSFHRANARFRGVTDFHQYANFLNESGHDLFRLFSEMFGNDHRNTPGHQREMKDNFVAAMNGGRDVGKAQLFTAATLYKIDDARNVPLPALGQWIPLNGAGRTEATDGLVISSAGLQDPVGLYSTMYVEPGDKLYIRLKAKSTNGAPDFSFGSNNLRTGPNANGDTRKVPLEAGADYQLYDYILRCQYAGTVSININVHENPEQLRVSTVQVKDLEISYIQEKDLQFAPLEGRLKTEVGQIEERINSIR
jgi:hypothetical protein